MNKIVHVDLKEIFPVTGSWIYYKTDTTQIVDWALDNSLTVRIILPHDLYEWFVEVYDSNKIRLLSDWYEVYGKEERTLKAELREDIQELCDKIAENKTRLIVKRKWPYIYKKFQFSRDQLWIDIINKKELKLF